MMNRVHKSLEVLTYIALTSAACFAIATALALFAAYEIETLTHQSTYDIQRRLK